jgi:hypothetical protein
VTALTLLIVGLFLLLIGLHLVGSSPNSSTGILSKNKFGLVLQDAGALLVGSSAVAVLWELVVRRAFVDEILDRTGTATSIAKAGITACTFDFHHDVPWKELLDEGLRLDAFFAWAEFWRESHGEQIRTLARRRSSRIRVILPDPQDQATIDSLAQRFQSDPGTVTAKVQSALRYFLDLKHDGGNVRVWTVSFPHTFSTYVIDETGVLALYSHRPVDVSIPAFVCRRGGTLYKYISDEIESIVRSGGTGKEHQ